MKAFKKNFNSGLLSPLLDGRTDLPQYAGGCRVLQNFIPRTFGGVFKRPGTEYIGRVKNDMPARLLPFNYSINTTFVFELGDFSIRFWSNGQQVVLPTFTVSRWSGTSSSYTPGTWVEDGAGVYAANTIHTPTSGNEPPSTQWNTSAVKYWFTSTAYTKGQIVFYGNGNTIYLVLANHTSSSNPDVDTTNYLVMPETEWQPAVAFAVGQTAGNYVGSVFSVYRCKVAHTAGSTTQPGVGSSWTPYWDNVDATPAWVTARPYVLFDFVVSSGSVYVCVTAHTSGTFATDLSAGKWVAFSITPWVVASTARAAGDIVLWGNRAVLSANVAHTSVTSIDFSKFNGLSFPAAWSASAQYNAGAVVYDGTNAALYYALVQHTTLSTTEPGTSTGSAYWQLLKNVFNWTTATNYVVGQYVVNAGTTYLVVTSHTSGTFATDLANGLLASSPYPLELATTYGVNDLPQVNLVEVNDQVVMLHPAYPPSLLQRFGDTLWNMGQLPWKYPPMRDQNVDDAFTITPSATTGNITLTASKALFQPGMVGGYFQISQRRQTASTTLELNAVGTSTPVEVLGSYSVFIYGTAWTGNVVLEQSDDGSTNWLPLRNWQQPVANMRTVSTTGSTDNQIFLRFNMTTHTAGTTTDYATLEAGDSLVNGLVQITAVNSQSSANATVINALEASTATTIWNEGAYSNYRGFPSTGTLHEVRLALAGVLAEPQKVRLSVTNDFFNFQESAQAADTGALAFQVASLESNAIQWLASYQGYLIIGTSGEEYSCDSGGSGKAMTPTNPPLVKIQSRCGSANIWPLIVGNALILFQNDTEHVFEFTYDFYTNKFVAQNLTLLAEQITRSGIKQVAVARQPEHVLYMVMNDGRLLTFTYEREQQVVAFAEHITAGQGVESVAVVYGGALNADEVWLVVRRTSATGSVTNISAGGIYYSGAGGYPAITTSQPHGLASGQVVTVNLTCTDSSVITGQHVVGLYGNPTEFYLSDMFQTGTIQNPSGGTYSSATQTRCVERLNQVTQKYRFNTDPTQLCYLDSSVLVQLSTPGTAVTGLGSLEGQSVMVLADGKVQGPFTVSNGAITLSAAASTVRVGLSYTAMVQGMKLDVQLQDGDSAGRKQKLNRALVLSYQSNGFDTNADPSDSSLPWRTVENGDVLDIANRTLVPTTVLSPAEGRFARQLNFSIRSSTPLPVNILGITYDFDNYGVG